MAARMGYIESFKYLFTFINNKIGVITGILRYSISNFDIIHHIFDVILKDDIVYTNHFLHYRNENLFISACMFQTLEDVKYLWKIGLQEGVDMISNEEEYSFIYACERGSLEIAQWLWNTRILHGNKINLNGLTEDDNGDNVRLIDYILNGKGSNYPDIVKYINDLVLQD